MSGPPHLVARLLIALFFFHICLGSNCTYSCHENGSCVDTNAFSYCACNENFYGNGTDCKPCLEGQSAPFGSIMLSNCTCSEGKTLSRFGTCIEVCTAQEEIQFTSTFVDFGLLYSSGCEPMSISKQCCDELYPLLQHPCYDAGLQRLMGVEDDDIAPYFYLFIQTYTECGVNAADGKFAEGCGDGALVGWEHCDDGNDEGEDGCFECFVEDGFSCSERANETSVCRVCAEMCTELHRDVCREDYGACGPCVDGYEELNGDCGVRLQVVYTAVDTPYLAADTEAHWSCNFTSVGSVVETREIPTSAIYLNLVREEMGLRAAPPEGRCSLRAALSMHNTQGVVVVAELFHDVVKAENIDLGLYDTWSFVVVFSEENNASKVTSTGEFLFDVFAGSTLLVYNVDFVDIRGHSGGLIRSYASVCVLEHVSIINATTFDITPDIIPAENAGIYTYSCEGLTIAAYGTLILHNVNIIGSDMFPMTLQSACVSYYPHQIVNFGRTDFINVTILDNVASNFLTSHGMLTFENVELTGNTAYGVHTSGALVKASIGFEMSNVTFRNNEAAGAVLDLDAPTTMQNVTIADNHVTGTDSHIRVSLTASIVNSTIQGNTRAYPDGSVMAIRGTFLAADVAFLEHESVRVVVDNSADATFIRCTFAEYQQAIENLGSLQIHESTFLDDSHGIQSGDPILMYDSFYPLAETEEWIATCSSVVKEDSGQYLPPCGLNAACHDWTSEDDLDGINCGCGSYTIGDSLVLCANLSLLHVLPEPDVTAYATKSRANQVVTRDRWLLAEGIGQLDWEVVSALPPWLSITPGLTGSFTSDGVCPDNMEEIWFNFHLGHVHRGDNLETVVVFRNFASYDGIFVDNAEYNDDDVAVHVLAHVEVIPSSNTSWVFYDWPCTNDSNPCVVAAGREVSSTIILRDADDYGLGVGGDTFTVESSVDGLLTFSSHDHETGRYTLWFEVPSSGYKENRDFGVRIRLYGNEIQGSPLLFRMECEGDEEWDDGEKKCALDLGIPKTLIAVTMLSIFVVGVFVIRFLKGRALSVQVAALQQEATTILFWCLLDLIDLGTDIGCGVSVYMKESLSAYVPFYFATLTIVIIASGYGFYLRFKVLSQVLRNTFKLRRTSHNGRKLPHPLSVSGITGMTRLEYESDVVLALERIRRDLKSKLYTLAMLFVEDIPMLVLSTIVIMVSSESDQSVIVLISLQSTCIMVGIKLTKITGIWRLLKLSERLYAKLGELNRMHEEPTGRPLKENCFSRPRGQMDKPGAGLRIFTSVHWLYGQDGGANGGVVNWKAEKRNRSSIGLSGYQPKDRGRSK
eukprot:Rmarinus@m.14548